MEMMETKSGGEIYLLPQPGHQAALLLLSPGCQWSLRHSLQTCVKVCDYNHNHCKAWKWCLFMLHLCSHRLLVNVVLLCVTGCRGAARCAAAIQRVHVLLRQTVQITVWQFLNNTVTARSQNPTDGILLRFSDSSYKCNVSFPTLTLESSSCVRSSSSSFLMLLIVVWLSSSHFIVRGSLSEDVLPVASFRSGGEELRDVWRRNNSMANLWNQEQEKVQDTDPNLFQGFLHAHGTSFRLLICWM